MELYTDGKNPKKKKSKNKQSEDMNEEEEESSPEKEESKSPRGLHDQIEYNDKPNEVFYFTNRLEIGKHSVYPNLEATMQHLNDPKPEEEKESMFDGMKKKMFTSNRDS